MMDSTESERMSGLLSTYLGRMFTGTQEEVDIRRRAYVLQDLFNQFDHDLCYCINSGSRGERLLMKGSDMDLMAVYKNVTVMYPDQCIPPNMAHNTILFMREADCRPGYVNLQLGQIGQQRNRALHHSLVRIENAIFVSSDMHREECVGAVATISGLHYESNGPSSSLQMKECDRDIVYCFPCNSWPKEANEWITRTRLYGWPHQTLLDRIAHSGCHLVPVGDKCSEDTFLQWRISFATAEKALVHSFSHIQFKVYCLLKYFLKQIKGTLKETIGDDDILCSYFLKTVLFHAIENSSQMLWQDKNLFYCFGFCFNILIAWVRARFCPNYFILGNNLFQRKVHGQHQIILMDILNNFCQMKWMCLSDGNFFNPSIWDDLCNSSIQAQLVRPNTVQDIVLGQDVMTVSVLLSMGSVQTSPVLRTLRKVLRSLSTSHSDFDDVNTYHYAMSELQFLATEQIYPKHTIATDNKTRYRSLKKCKHWMIPNASMGSELLRLATFHFLTGNFSKPLAMCKQVMKLASYYTKVVTAHPEEQAMYGHEYRQYGHTLDRLRKIYKRIIYFHKCRDIFLPHLCLELSKQDFVLCIPPLPYALFLSFLCCHELGDLRGREAALHRLIEVQYDGEQGGHDYWIVHTLLGICYQTLGDNHRAIRAYWDSAQSKADYHELNPAFKRIAVVYLCMSHRGLTEDRCGVSMYVCLRGLTEVSCGVSMYECLTEV